MTTRRRIAVGLLLGTVLGSAAFAADRDPRGLAKEIVKRLVARRSTAQIHATDFQGVDIGCIVLRRRELRRYGYPGHAMLCEVSATGEVLGSILGRTGNRICDPITGAYVGDFCYDIDICGYAETLCTQ